jgi:hypothetical protein
MRLKVREQAPQGATRLVKNSSALEFFGRVDGGAAGAEVNAAWRDDAQSR